MSSNQNPSKKTFALSHLFWIIIVLILLAGNLFFRSKYLESQKDLYQAQTFAKTQKLNQSVLRFTELFIDKVLREENEVSFETRLELENAVRDLEDKEILAQWQKFTESKTEEEAQDAVKNLLGILVDKIIVST